MFRKRWLIAAAAYYGLLSYLSHLPGQVLHDLGFNLWDKAMHFCAYGVLGLFLGFGLSRRPGSARFAVIATALLVAVLGSLDEVHQLFTHGRSATVSDAAADLLGGIAGALATVVIVRLRATPRQCGTT